MDRVVWAITGCTLIAGWMDGASAQSRPVHEPVLVAPGVISTGNVWRGSLSPDGEELYFFRQVAPGTEDYRIEVSRRTGTGWSEPRSVEFSSEYSDLYPTVAPSGNVMILTSYRPVSGVPPNAHLFISNRSEAGWSEPRYVEELNAPGEYHAQPYYTADGSLYFRRVGESGPQVFRAEFRDGRVVGIEEVDFRSPFSAPDLDIRGTFFSPSECVAVLTVQRTRGNVDLYVSRKMGGGWEVPARLAEGINGPGMELFPFFDPTGESFFFVRDFGELFYVEFRSEWLNAAGCTA